MIPAEPVLELDREVTPASEAAIRQRASLHIDFDFFGALVRLFVTSQHERSQWEYFFKEFVAPNSNKRPVVSIWVEVEGTKESFIESIFRKDHTLKSIHVERRGRFRLYSRFSHWSSAPSPLPPFHIPPLNRRLCTFHASAVVERTSGKAILFLAEPYQGKSTLANSFVRRGGAPLSDNVTVVQANPVRVLPYLTPTGIREETLHILPGLRNAVASLPEHWITVSEVTGTVYLIHFDAIVPFEKPAPTEIGLLVYPRNLRRGEKTFALRRLERGESVHRLEPFRIPSNGPTELGPRVVHELAVGAPSVELDYSLESCDIDAVSSAIAEQIGRP